MAVFYLMPPRLFLGEHLSSYLRSLLPGLERVGASWEDMGEHLVTAAARRSGAFIVYREELPEGEDPAQALANGFGAESGDEVIEVRPGVKPGELITRRWQVNGR